MAMDRDGWCKNGLRRIIRDDGGGTRRDLLVDARSRQTPPISSKHTAQQTIAHTPTGSSDMVVVQTRAG